MLTGENIAVIGTIFVDIKGFAGKHYNPCGRNVGEVRLVHGGVGRNVAENLARLGNNVTFVSSVNDDGLGRGVLERLRGEGIETRYVHLSAAAGMGLWVVINDAAGKQAGAVSQMPDVRLMESVLDRYGEDIAAMTGHIVLEIDLSESISRRMLGLAQAYRKKVYALPGNMEVLLRNPGVLRSVSCFICNDVEAGRLLGVDTAGKTPEEMEQLARRGVQSLGMPAFVITLGEKGCVFCSAEGESGWEKAIPTVVRDASGAGDAFFAGAVTALAQGCCLREAVRAGTRAASFVLSSEENTLPATAACACLEEKEDSYERR